MFTTLTNRTSSNNKAPHSPAASPSRRRLVPRAGSLFLSSAHAGQPTRARLLRAFLAASVPVLLLGAGTQRSLAQDPVERYATQDIPIHNGGMVGNYTDTFSSNNVYEQITELVAKWGGGGHAYYTYLTHAWRFEVEPGSLTYSFRLEAYKTESHDDDNFVFAYSTDGQNYTNMLTVTKTADDNSVQVYTFPYPMDGTIYVRVKDTNPRPNSHWADTIYIDHMYIRAEGTDDEPPVISDVVGTDHASTWYCENPEVFGGPLVERERHDMAYDAVADRTVMFGGGDNGGWLLNDTWIYGANAWNNAFPAVLGGTLEPRIDHAMVYDAFADRIVMFGGTKGEGVMTNETWIYSFSANTWSKVEPIVEGGTLEPRCLHAMAYDMVAQRTIMFGGYTGAARLNDTWVYDCAGNRWSKLNPSFMGGTLTARGTHAMVYDSSANKTILFGGSDSNGKLNDTWVYDYTQNEWVKHNPSFIGGTLVPRSAHALAYHAAADKTILFGGYDGKTQLSDTWVYDYGLDTWSRAVSPAMSGGDLQPREFPAMVYDSSAGRPLLFGGFTTSGCNGCGLNDTWTYGISDRAATITWKTNEPSDSVVCYRLTSGGEWATVSDAALVLDHRVVLEDLTLGVEYCYQVESTDASQNTATDDNGGLYYRIPDTTPPVITQVASSDITTSSARITWTTDELGDSVVRYGLTPGQWTTVSDSAPVTSHSVALSQLYPGTLYYYQVESTDASSNKATDNNDGDYYSFTTLPANTMHVDAIDMWYTLGGGKYRIYTKVKIVDGAGGALGGAVVDLKLTLPGGGSSLYNGTTASDGTVTFQYGPTKVLGTYTSTVMGVSKSGWTYAYWENDETSESLVVP